MNYDLPRTTLGRTGLEVTRLGIGGAYCKTVDGYRQALDTGVTYVDTARVYCDGEDEKCIGEAIQGRRHELVVATKTGARDAKGLRADLETSLRQLRTDCLDVYQLHHLNTREEREETVFPAAHAHDTGVVIMNAGRNDKLFREPDSPAPEQFYRYVLANASVHLTIIGLRNVPRFVTVAAALAQRDHTKGEEREELEEYGAMMRSAGKLD